MPENSPELAPIVSVRTHNIGFAEEPETLARHLVTPTSVLYNTALDRRDWFGPHVCTLVEVEAADGTVGIGTAGAFNGAAAGVVDAYLAPLVIGSVPSAHELMWQAMYRSTVRFGRTGVGMSALSAVDIACWDLHGKQAGLPVVELLGGRVQDRVPVYASRLYALHDADELADEARAHVADGFTMVKQRFGFGPADGWAGIERNVALVRTVREAVGDDIGLAADAYMGWDVGYAMEMADRLREYDLMWIEEPLMPHDFDGYRELAARCGTQRWSCGEHLYTKWEFDRLLRDRSVSYLQPDVNRVGGITEVRKILALAETAGTPVIPHSNEAHNLHAVFSQAAHVCPMVEYFPDRSPDTGNELFWRLFDGNPRTVDGTLGLPDGPGLGISVNEEVIARVGA